MLLNAILWGSSYIWSKILLGYLPYFTILFLYSAGGLILLTALFFRRLRHIKVRTVLAGLGIGMFSVLSNIFCMMALGSTGSSNTAFIVQLSVILTPMLMSVYEKKLPGARVVAGALAAAAGLLLLTCDFSTFAFNPGDLFALGNALLFSLYMVSLKIFTGKADPVQFTFMQHITSTAVFFCMALLFGAGIEDFGEMSMKANAVLVISILISVTTILIQASAIRFVRPEKAAVIYTAEPVAAAVFAYFLVSERINGVGSFIGCVLILIAIILTVDKKRSIHTRKNKVKYNYWQLPARVYKKDA